MNLVSINISKIKKERKYLPLEIRLQMYDDVIELRKQGLTYKEIQRKIYEKYGKQIFLPQICNWINKKHCPLGKVNKFDDRPSPELSYIIGVILGDGFKRFDGKGYLLRLAVDDKEFAEEFGKCLAKVLGRKPYKPYWNKKPKQWIVAGCSILLYKFLDKPLEELKPCIEYSKNTISAFLRALFDGEGSMHVNAKYYMRTLRLYNTNEELLNYAKYLLKKYFKINATGPHLARKKGEVINIVGVIRKTKKDYYYLYIHAKSLSDFCKYIGFTIERKQKRLIRAIK